MEEDKLKGIVDNLREEEDSLPTTVKFLLTAVGLRILKGSTGLSHTKEQVLGNPRKYLYEIHFIDGPLFYLTGEVVKDSQTGNNFYMIREESTFSLTEEEGVYSITTKVNGIAYGGRMYLDGKETESNLLKAFISETVEASIKHTLSKINSKLKPKSFPPGGVISTTSHTGEFIAPSLLVGNRGTLPDIYEHDRVRGVKWEEIQVYLKKKKIQLTPIKHTRKVEGRRKTY